MTLFIPFFRKLIIDVAAASGSYYANEAILEYIKKDKLSQLQIMSFFMTLTNNAECPMNIPHLMVSSETKMLALIIGKSSNTINPSVVQAKQFIIMKIYLQIIFII